MDIEELLAALEMLDKRHEDVLAPFVAAWDPRVEMLDARARQFAAAQAARAIRATIVQQTSRALTKAEPEDGETVAGAFARAHHHDIWAAQAGMYGIAGYTHEPDDPLGHVLADMYRVSPHSGVFDDARRRIQRLLREILVHAPGKAGYFEPLIREMQRQSGFPVVTLNYDLVFEDAFRQFASDVDLDVVTSHDDRFVPRISLCKLHGSIDWAYREPDEHSADLYRVHRVEPSKQDPLREPALLIGGASKLTPLGPFLDLFARFKQELEGSTMLTTIGYAFADEHVNHVIRGWLYQEKHRRIRIVDPNPVWAASPTHEDWVDMMRAGNQIQFIRKPAAVVMPTLWPSSFGPDC